MTSLMRRFSARTAARLVMPFGALAVVEPAAGAVAVAELGDRGDVDDVVEGAVPAA